MEFQEAAGAWVACAPRCILAMQHALCGLEERAASAGEDESGGLSADRSPETEYYEEPE